MGISPIKTIIRNTLYNEGTIISPVIVTVLGNSTINVPFGQKIVLFANITTSDGASVSGGELNFIINNNNYTATDQGNGTYNCIYTPSTTGMQLVNAMYANANEVTVKTAVLNVNKNDSFVIVSVSNIKFGENVTVTATVTPGATGNVTFVIGDRIETVLIRDGVASWVVSGLVAGNYTVLVNYNGDGNYKSSSNSSLFEVDKVDPTISVDVKDIAVGEDATITVTVTMGATGNVTITINGKTETVDINNSKAILVVKNLSRGTYTIEATYNGDNNYNKVNTTESINVGKVTKYDINITTDIDKNDVIVDIKLPADANGNATLSIDGEKQNVSVFDGHASVKLTDLSLGNHTIIVSYDDDKYDTQSVVRNITIVGPVEYVLTVDNVVKYFKGDERLVANLVDGNGNPIANATIYFSINGALYNRTTDAKGIASMAINLDSGFYNVITTYGNESVRSNVTIMSTIEGNDIVKMFQNGTGFVAKFLDSNGNPLVKTEVQFNINGVFYKRQTDANGIAKLNINLNPENYTLTAYNPVNGEEKGFNVLVKSLIETSDLTKYYKNASQFTVKVYNKDGSLANGKNVTFNINGVLYHRPAVNGYATLGINLKPGNYVITSMYDGYEVGNSVTVLPTLITKDLSMNFQDGSKFQAKTLDGQGNPLVKQNITFNVNGVFYHRTTNENGIAELNINLNSGKYIITSIWNDYQVGNNITIV